MVAKGVNKATAPTRTCREWEVQTHTTEKDGKGESCKGGIGIQTLWFKVCGEGSACKAASLGLTKKNWLAGGFAAWSFSWNSLWSTPGTGRHFEFQYVDAHRKSRARNESNQNEDVGARGSDPKIGKTCGQSWRGTITLHSMDADGNIEPRFSNPNIKLICRHKKPKGTVDTVAVTRHTYTMVEQRLVDDDSLNNKWAGTGHHA